MGARRPYFHWFSRTWVGAAGWLDSARDGGYPVRMSLVLPFLAGLALYFIVRYFLSRKKTPKNDMVHELAVLEPWIHEVLGRTLGRKLDLGERLFKAFAGEPDADVVTAVEGAVDRVELEFVKYAHETHAEVHLHVVFEDGTRHTEWTKKAVTELPVSVREDFEKKAVTRLYRTWEFPWGRRYTAL
jgi:hypothetical protein